MEKVSLTNTDVNEILDFWFIQFANYWFNCSTEHDQIVSQKFQFYHDKLQQSEITLSSLSTRQILAYIIIYDQFYRHYRRVQQLDVTIDIYNKLTCTWAQHLIKSELIRDLPTTQQCFVYLPLRHSKNLSLIRQVYEAIRLDKKLSENTNFVEATRRDLEKALYVYGEQQNQLTLSSSSNPDSLRDSFQILSIADLSNFSPLTRLMIKIGVVSLNLFEPNFIKNAPIYQHLLKTIIHLQQQNQIKRELAVSLSGGVDSLLLCFLLLQVKKDNYLDRIVAIHINYANRGQTSQLEADFVKSWCYYHGVDLYLREIDEIHRRHSETDSSNPDQLVLDRSFYENYTRDIRYHLYELVGLPVCLGHNRDDAFENMMSNIANGINYRDLKAMSEITVVPGKINRVQILRPFIQINKLEIIRTARQMQLYHTKNSTPKWSNRYFLRHGIIDYLANTYPQFLLGMEKLNCHLIESHRMTEDQISRILNDSLFLDDIKIDKSNQKLDDEINPVLLVKFQSDQNLSLMVNSEKHPILNPVIFQQIILHLSRSWKIQTPSHKSQMQNLQMIDNYRQMIKKHLKTGYRQKLHLSKEMKIHLLTTLP